MTRSNISLKYVRNIQVPLLYSSDKEKFDLARFQGRTHIFKQMLYLELKSGKKPAECCQKGSDYIILKFLECRIMNFSTWIVLMLYHMFTREAPFLLHFLTPFYEILHTKGTFLHLLHGAHT